LTQLVDRSSRCTVNQSSRFNSALLQKIFDKQEFITDDTIFVSI